MIRGLLCAVGAALYIGCTGAGIEPLDEEQTEKVDDLLTVAGTICTSDPDEVVFPVKIMVVVDSSGSMQFTDPSNSNVTSTVSGGNLNKNVNAKASCIKACSDPKSAGGAGLPTSVCAALCSNPHNPGRQAAVQELVDRFKNNPAVSFAIIRFNGRITVNGSDVTTSSSAGVFTNAEGTLTKAITGLAQADITTDYQGALTSAYQVLEKDMRQTSPVQRARTKYVILFLSDGGPNPVCKEGCGNDPSVIPNVDNWCDVPRDKWCETYFPNLSSSSGLCKDLTNWYPHLVEPCREYNSKRQIVQRIKEIVGLGKQYSAGEVRIHTAFLFVPTLPKDIQTLMAVDQVKSEQLLKDMAKEGNGVFRNFSTGQQIDFLSFNYASVSRPFGMTNFIVTNTNTIPSSTKLLADSDADGVPDSTEFSYGKGMKQGVADSDQDGFNDKLEYDRRTAGFDPGDSTEPKTVCSKDDRRDIDGDGLNACEEKVLGTDSKIVDTDRDRIPDGLEFVWGTNPLSPDDKLDIDFDGKLSGEEIRIHASPTIADPFIHSDFKYIYDVKEMAERPDRKRCYDFTVRRVRLVTTEEKGVVGSLGYNDILIYFDEGPADDPLDYGTFKAACVRVQYVKPNFKSPASGRVILTPADFQELSKLIAARAAALTDPGCKKVPPDSSCQDPCKGIPPP